MEVVFGDDDAAAASTSDSFRFFEQRWYLRGEARRNGAMKGIWIWYGQTPSYITLPSNHQRWTSVGWFFKPINSCISHSFTVPLLDGTCLLSGTEIRTWQ